MGILRPYLEAAYPAICIQTQEPDRAVRVVNEDGWKTFEWDCLRGIIGDGQASDEVNPVDAIAWLNSQKDTVLVARNLHLFLDSIPEITQAIENGVSIWKGMGSCLVMLSPSFPARPELEKLFHVIDLPLPSIQELFAMQLRLIETIDLQDSNGNKVEINPDSEVARAARGLTEFEAETAFAKCLSQHGRFDLKTITDIKGQMIKKSGTLQYWEPADIADVGGLQGYKDFVSKRLSAFKNESKLPAPRGVILVGPPGTGKSLVSKATASILQRPLIRFDIGAAKGSLVGESEKLMRTSLRTLEAFGECVVWVR